MDSDPRRPMTVEGVRRLIVSQFPEWSNLPIQVVENPGWDHWSFRLGETMVIRLPSAARYANQVIKEQRWLKNLAPHLSIEIPRPLVLGIPCALFPWNWSISDWIEGEIAEKGEISSLEEFAESLVVFLQQIQSIDSQGGPEAGPENFYRGARLRHYNSETRTLADRLKNIVDKNQVIALWERAMSSAWKREAVWVHGDLSSRNILVRGGKLRSVIDFGLMAIGDPACDLVMTWTFFRGASRERFRGRLNFDSDTWSRARGWCLWKALLTLEAQQEQEVDFTETLALIQTIFTEHGDAK